MMLMMKFHQEFLGPLPLKVQISEDGQMQWLLDLSQNRGYPCQNKYFLCDTKRFCLCFHSKSQSVYKTFYLIYKIFINVFDEYPLKKIRGLLWVTLLNARQLRELVCRTWNRTIRTPGRAGGDIKTFKKDQLLLYLCYFHPSWQDNQKDRERCVSPPCPPCSSLHWLFCTLELF